jgi:hypothetical protein
MVQATHQCFAKILATLSRNGFHSLGECVILNPMLIDAHDGRADRRPEVWGLVGASALSMLLCDRAHAAFGLARQREVASTV